MTLPKIAKKIISDTLLHLSPINNYSHMIKFYHNSVRIKDDTYNLPAKIHIFGVGKAASYEVQALRELFIKNGLQDKLGHCVSYTKINHTVEEKGLLQFEGTHPVISAENLEKTSLFLRELKKIKNQDCLFFLLSGGASSLLELPLKQMKFSTLRVIHQDLLASGMNINAMNQVRKSISQIKNGGLRNYIPTDNIIQFITCDIPNADLSDVGSGPLLSKNINLREVNSYLEKFDIKLNETDNSVVNVKSYISQSAEILLQLMSVPQKMINKGIYDGGLEELISLQKKDLPSKGYTFLSGGEATLTVPPQAGKGGRNTHYVLAMASELYRFEENRDIHILSFGTDGTDGPTDAAGAYINYALYSKLDSVQYLRNFDSYTFFEKIGSLIKTGPTRTNVMDIRAMWRE